MCGGTKTPNIVLWKLRHIWLCVLYFIYVWLSRGELKTTWQPHKRISAKHRVCFRWSLHPSCECEAQEHLEETSPKLAALKAQSHCERHTVLNTSGTLWGSLCTNILEDMDDLGLHRHAFQLQLLRFAEAYSCIVEIITSLQLSAVIGLPEYKIMLEKHSWWW